MAWWPHGNYPRIQPYEGGTIADALPAAFTGGGLHDGKQRNATAVWPDNQSLAVVTRDGGHVYDVAFALVWANQSAQQERGIRLCQLPPLQCRSHKLSNRLDRGPRARGRAGKHLCCGQLQLRRVRRVRRVRHARPRGAARSDPPRTAQRSRNCRHQRPVEADQSLRRAPPRAPILRDPRTTPGLPISRPPPRPVPPISRPPARPVPLRRRRPRAMRRVQPRPSARLPRPPRQHPPAE
jgi:hypothetical protein